MSTGDRLMVAQWRTLALLEKNGRPFPAEPLSLGVVAHEGSTVLVVLNSLRLKGYGRG